MNNYFIAGKYYIIYTIEGKEVCYFLSGGWNYTEIDGYLLSQRLDDVPQDCSDEVYFLRIRLVLQAIFDGSRKQYCLASQLLHKV